MEAKACLAGFDGLAALVGVLADVLADAEDLGVVGDLAMADSLYKTIKPHFGRRRPRLWALAKRAYFDRRYLVSTISPHQFDRIDWINKTLDPLHQITLHKKLCLSMPRPQETKITSPKHAQGSELEVRVFTALLAQREALQLIEITQCHGIYADGWVRTQAGSKIPIEIKTTLGWPQLTSACFQLVSLSKRLHIEAQDAWIIYTKISPEWMSRKKVAGLAHANACIADFRVGLNFKFVELDNSGVFNFKGGTGSA